MLADITRGHSLIISNGLWVTVNILVYIMLKIWAMIVPPKELEHQKNLPDSLPKLLKTMDLLKIWDHVNFDDLSCSQYLQYLMKNKVSKN